MTKPHARGVHAGVIKPQTLVGMAAFSNRIPRNAHLDNVRELRRSGATVGRVELETGVVHGVVRGGEVERARHLEEGHQRRADASGALASKVDLDLLLGQFLCEAEKGGKSVFSERRSLPMSTVGHKPHARWPSVS